MIIGYIINKQGKLIQQEIDITQPAFNRIIWIDLYQPTQDEENWVMKYYSADLPSLEEINKIEVTSPFFREKNAYYMTITIIDHVESDYMTSSAMTFILTPTCLITVRYANPLSLKSFSLYAMRHPLACASPDVALTGIVEVLINYIGDILEKSGNKLDLLLRAIFEKSDTATIANKDNDANINNNNDPNNKDNTINNNDENIFTNKNNNINNDKNNTKIDNKSQKSHKRKNKKITASYYNDIIKEIGREGNSISKNRESLVSISRMLIYFIQIEDSEFINKREYRSRLKHLNREIHSMNEYANFLSQRNSFLLDATLGMISVEQNLIIKIFTIASVVFMPPTLIASIYGMNFANMPELNFSWGYHAAIIGMLLSAIIPYIFFKIKDWV